MDHDETITEMAERIYPDANFWYEGARREAFVDGAKEACRRLLWLKEMRPGPEADFPEDAEGEPEAMEGALVVALTAPGVRVVAVMDVGEDSVILEPMHPTGRDTGSGVIEMVTDPVSYSGRVVRIEVERGQLRRRRVIAPVSVPTANRFWHALTMDYLP